MSWSTFQEVGKLREVVARCNFGVKLDLNGLAFVFPDGWRIDAQHLKERSIEAIVSWLTVLWTIRTKK